MSKTNKNVLGDQRGKIGKVVGRVVEGEQMYSAYSGGGKNPRTPKQVAHRSRFAAAVAMGKAMKGVLNVGLRDMAARRKLCSAYNVFVNVNMSRISYDEEHGAAVVDYASVVVSDGDVPTVTFGNAVFTEPLKVTVSYSSAEEAGAYDDDSVYVAVYAPALGRCMMGIGTRAGGTVSVTLPQRWAGEVVHIWGCAKTKVDVPTPIEAYGIKMMPNECSRSEYIGSGTIETE